MCVCEGKFLFGLLLGDGERRRRNTPLISPDGDLGRCRHGPMVVTVKVALMAPSATVTLGGTVATAGLRWRGHTARQRAPLRSGYCACEEVAHHAGRLQRERIRRDRNNASSHSLAMIDVCPSGEGCQHIQ
jgi:hypothetical protein